MRRFLYQHWGKLLVTVLLAGVSLPLAASSWLRSRAIHYGNEALAQAGLLDASHESDTVYWCPMDPQIKRTNPNDICPICNMALVELEGGAMEPPLHLTLTAQQIQQTGVATAPVLRRKLYREVDTTGHLALDERRLAQLTSWVQGQSRIEKLHVNFTGESVRRGEVLAELYSPTLIAAQEEYLIALESPGLGPRAARGHDSAEETPAAESRMLRSAAQKLKYQGMTPSQIDRLRTSGQVLDRIAIHASISGTVIRRAVQEGQYVDEGEVLLEVADLDQLWLFADIYEEELPLVELGQPVTIQVRSLPDVPFPGTVSFIDPQVDPQTRTVAVRVDVENPDGQLKPGMFAGVQFRQQIAETAAVPENAVLWSGQRQVVIVRQGEGTFQPREVRLGARWVYADAEAAGSDGIFNTTGRRQRYHQVLAGLAPGDQVVTSGAFLLNAESQFQSVLAKMLPPESQSASLEEVLGELLAERLRSTLEAYYGLSQALAEDQLEPIAGHTAALVQAAERLSEQGQQQGEEELARAAARLAKHAQKLGSPQDLRQARLGFGRISRSLVQLLADHGGQTLLGKELFVFHCGMSNVGYENWLWWSPDKYNPYMGQRMLACGTRLEMLEEESP